LLAFSPDSKTFVTEGKEVSVWDALSGRELDRFSSPGRVLAAGFSAEGKDLTTLVLKDFKTTDLRLWDVTIGETRAILRGHSGSVECATFSPDGRIIATGGDDQSVRLWDPVIGQQFGILRAHKATVDQIAFSPNGRTLATASFDGDVRLWIGDGNHAPKK